MTGIHSWLHWRPLRPAAALRPPAWRLQACVCGQRSPATTCTVRPLRSRRLPSATTTWCRVRPGALVDEPTRQAASWHPRTAVEWLCGKQLADPSAPDGSPGCRQSPSGRCRCAPASRPPGTEASYPAWWTVRRPSARPRTPPLAYSSPRCWRPLSEAGSRPGGARRPPFAGWSSPACKARSRAWQRRHRASGCAPGSSVPRRATGC